MAKSYNRLILIRYIREKCFKIKKTDFDNESEFDIRVFFITWFYCNTYVDQHRLVTGPQVVQHRSLIQVSHVGHVINFLVFWRVHLLDVIFLHCAVLRIQNEPYILQIKEL